MRKTLSFALTFALIAVFGAFAGGDTDTGGETTSGGETMAGTSGGFTEGSWFAEMVARGELPPVDERLPDSPIVVRPGDGYAWHENGVHGPGSFDRTSDSLSGQQGMTSQPIMNHKWETGVLLPYILISWDGSADNKTWTFQINPGLKWSDGVPHTVDDYLFWFEHLQSDQEYRTFLAADANAIAKGTDRIEKVDDTVMRFHLTEADPRFDALVRNRSEREMNASAAHYLEQYHAATAGDAQELANKVSSVGMDSWMQLLEERIDRMGTLNPEKPHLMAWGPEVPPPANPAIWTANPYFFMVDSDGNQLPYLEKQRWFLVSDGEAKNLRLLAGADSWGIMNDLTAVPIARAAKERGEIDFQLTPKGDAYKSTATVFNMDAPDEWKRELFRDVRWRQAWSLFVPRTKINDILYAGSAVNTLGGLMYETEHPWYEPMLANSDLIEQDIPRANALLDELLPNKDANGFRLGPDGQPVTLLSIGIADWAPITPVGAMIVEDLHLIGLKANMRTVGWGAAGDAKNSLEYDIWWDQSSEGWLNQLPERQNLAAPTGVFGTQWATGWWQWLDSDGANGEEPPQEIKDNWATWEAMKGEADPNKLADLARQWYRAQAEQVWTIPHHTFPPEFDIWQPNLRNINPRTGRPPEIFGGMWYAN